MLGSTKWLSNFHSYFKAKSNGLAVFFQVHSHLRPSWHTPQLQSDVCCKAMRIPLTSIVIPFAAFQNPCAPVAIAQSQVIGWRCQWVSSAFVQYSRRSTAVSAHIFCAKTAYDSTWFASWRKLRCSFSIILPTVEPKDRSTVGFSEVQAERCFLLIGCQWNSCKSLERTPGCLSLA